MSERDATAGDGGQAQELGDDELARAAELAAEQAAATAEQPASSRPLRGDRKPRKRASRKRAPRSAEQLRGAALKAQSSKLEKALGEVLTFPAIPAMMFSPDAASQAFLPQHFAAAGPRTAHELVVASESQPELRALLERIAYGSSMFTVALALLAYAAPPVLWTIGMRQQAMGLSMAAQMDESTLASMIAEREQAAAAAAERAAADAPAAPPTPQTAGPENGGDPFAAPAAPGPGSL